MSNLEAAIKCLTESPHYKELRDYKPPFNSFEAMSVTSRELTHSSVLAWLLKDGANKKFRQKFVAWIANQSTKLDEEIKHEFNFYHAEDDNDIEVRCEYGDEKSRIDIFAHFRSLELVIGIEVKVWAGEQPEQVSRYQDLLNDSYSNYKNKIVIFLTPWGDKSTTAYPPSQCSNVPVLLMSWGDIANIINEVNDASENIGEKYIFRKQFSQHIKRNILMEEREKELVSNLLSDPSHEETIQKIINNMPSLNKYSDGWKQIVANVCKTDKSSLEEETWPKKSPQELKLTIPEWENAGLPFTLMLYSEGVAIRTLAIRILLRSHYLNHGGKEIDKLEELKDKSNGLVEYKKLKGWGTWSSVLSSDRERAEVPETKFNNSDYWKREAEEVLRKLLEKKNDDGKNLLDLINNLK